VAKRLSHLDEKGAARMVDVAEKTATAREATAECTVRMAPETVRAVREGRRARAGRTLSKGDALQVARVAGIMAAKRTPDLIPLCHPLPLSSVSVDFEFVTGGVRVLTKVRVVGQTGVEMEALTAAAVAGLTLIDMVKGVERGVYLESVRLLEKSGGRSGTWKRST
jgi:cyclic pyranopterin phosphate synthase